MHEMRETVTIKSCSGCHGEHEALAFQQLAQPVDGDTHVTTCPATGKELTFHKVTSVEVMVKDVATCQHDWASFDQVNTLNSPHRAILDDVDATGATAAEQAACEFCLLCRAVRWPGNPEGIGGWMGTLLLAIPCAVVTDGH